jgi:putative ABC transport system permease protein
MRLSDLVKLSLRMFKARTMRTLLTVLGMSVGTAAVLLLVSLGYGLQKTVLERITTADSLASLDISSPRPDERPLDTAAVEAVRGVEGVAEVSPSVRLAAQGKFGGVTLDLYAVGISPEFFRLNGTKAAEGRLPEAARPDGAVISSSVALAFGENASDMLGHTVQVALFPQAGMQEEGSGWQKGRRETRTYVVTGVVESEENAVYVGLDTVPPDLFWRYDQLKAKARSTESLEAVRNAVVDLGFAASSLSETVDQANKVFRFVQFVLMLFGIVALVVSAIGMFNTMTIALLERTEEIGIMKSIGASRGSISLMFIVEASLMGLLGGVGGVVLGYGTGQAFNVLLSLVARRLGGEAVQLFYSPLWFVALIVFFGAFVGFLTGLFPARKASAIDPLEALRYK